jgi:hypothetical protein
MNTMKFVRKCYYKSSKAGSVYCESSYELKAATMLDADPTVLFYETHISFDGQSGKRRFIDFLVTRSGGVKEIIEIKPKRRLIQFETQINDNREYAATQGMNMSVWTEEDLGFKNECEAKHWADEYHTKETGIDYETARKERDTARTMRHYRKKIATDTVRVECKFCNEAHTALRLTHDKNIARNGRYICEKEGGHIAGSRPKPHLQKENPYFAEGKKQCTKCTRILTLDSFSDDKSRRDGKSSRCRECRK